MAGKWLSRSKKLNSGLWSGRPVDEKEANSSLRTRKNRIWKPRESLRVKDGRESRLGWKSEYGTVKNPAPPPTTTQPPTQFGEHFSFNQTEAGSFYSEEKCCPRNIRQSSGPGRGFVLKTKFKWNSTQWTLEYPQSPHSAGLSGHSQVCSLQKGNWIPLQGNWHAYGKKN